MRSSRLLRLGLAVASLSALFIATACGTSDEGGGDCEGTAPTCAVGSCGGSGGSSSASCNDGQWECPVYNAIDCVPDSGDDDANFSCNSDIELYCGTCDGVPIGQQCDGSGWYCPPLAPSCEEYTDGGACPDVAPVCGDCGDGSEIYPVCSNAEWICPIVNCPVQFPDGGPDSGDGGDGGPCHGHACVDSGPDSGPLDASPDSSPDAAPDAGVGTECAEGATCLAGMSCTIASAGQVPLSCECIDGEYACVP